jgi:antitoxin component of MazEF toxin-antitoxin module
MLSIRRKLHDQGGSLVLVLPKIWADSRGLRADDVVEIRLNENLTIVPLKAGAKPVEHS